MQVASTKFTLTQGRWRRPVNCTAGHRRQRTPCARKSHGITLCEKANGRDRKGHAHAAGRGRFGEKTAQSAHLHLSIQEKYGNLGFHLAHSLRIPYFLKTGVEPRPEHTART